MEEQQPKLLTREEFDRDMEIQKECYQTMKQYNDFDNWKDYFHFEIISYEQYLERYEKYYNQEQEEGAPKNNIAIKSIEQ